MNDWRPNNIPEPPAEATPLAPVSIRENIQEGEIVIDKTATQVVTEGKYKTVGEIPEVGTFKGLPVRVAGDKIWLLKGGKRQWVTSADMYAKLGFKFGDEKDIDAETLMLIPEGLPLR